MGADIVQLQSVRFNTRLIMGNCLININGNTVDCKISVDNANWTNPTYTVRDLQDKELCTFRPYHLSSVRDPTMFQIAGASKSGGTATLIVPLFDHKDCEYEDDD